MAEGIRAAHDERDYATSTDARDERPRGFRDQSANPGKRSHIDLSHFRAGQSSRGKNECPNQRLHQRALFNSAIPNALVLGQHDPTAPTRDGQPLHVLRPRREMVVVDVDDFAGMAKRLGHDAPTQRLIDKEFQRWSYAASGSSHRIASWISEGER